MRNPEPKPTIGYSMLPAILPGSTVEIAQVSADEVYVGDVICYINENKDIVAHRVVGIDGLGDDLAFITRGDAQDQCGQIPQQAVVGVVKAVNNRFFSYGSDGLIGRTFSGLALARNFPWTALHRTLVMGSKILARLAKGYNKE